MTSPIVVTDPITPTWYGALLWAGPTPPGGSPSTWAFPDAELAVKVEIAWGADPAADPSEWTFTDESDRLVRAPIQIRRGRGDGQSSLQASSCTFVLENTDGELTPTRRQSTLWPYVRLNTPVRLSLTNVGPNPPYTRFCGFISGFTLTFIPGAGGNNLAVVRIQVAGITRRLSQGAVRLTAPEKAILDPDVQAPTSYWALTEGQYAGVGTLTSGIGSAFSSIDWGTKGLVQSGTSDLAPWLGSGIRIGDDSYATAKTGMTSAPASRLVMDGTFVLEPEDGATSTGFLELTALVGSQAQGAWVVFVQQDSAGAKTVSIYGSDPNGVQLVFTAFTANTITAPGPHHLRMDLTVSGGNITWAVYLDGDLVGSATVAGTLAAFGWAELAYTSTGGGITFGHVATYVDVTPLPIAIAAGASLGFAGERAHVRVARVLDTEGVPSAVYGSDAMPLGPQPIATHLEICAEAEAADRGILFEPRDSFSVGYLAHTVRHNRLPAMTIDLDTYRTAEGSSTFVLAPVYDDQRVRNEWTANRPDGGTATVSDDDHITASGRYNDSTEANVETDELLDNLAAWLVHEGTVDELRYPAPPIDIGANPQDLLPAWLTADLGDVIRRTNPPTEHGGDEILDVLMGYAETLEPHGWKVTTSVVPASPWQSMHVVASRDGNLGRVDSATSTLNAGVDSVTTTLSVAVASGILWRTGATSFDLEVGPERMTVTNISGGASPQTFTVVRSVNGVTRSHDAGAEVHLWRPGVYGL